MGSPPPPLPPAQQAVTTLLVWQLAATSAAVVIVLVARAMSRNDAQPDEPAQQPPVLRPSALRLVMVSVVDGGIVLDGIVERGHTLGWPGVPVTLLLELADPCALATVVKELQGWAAANAVVDVALFADHGEATAALRTGDEALQLPILGLSS